MNAKTIRERTEALKAKIQQQGDISYTSNRKNTGIGTLYALEKLGLGFMRSVEGITDYVAGGIGDLFGADDFAENLMKNDWVNYSHADEWYRPGKGWSFVGDVAGGIGNMLPAIGLSFVPGAGGAVAAALSTGQFIGSAMGQSTSDAVKQTGDLSGKEWVYGTASGALEGLSEKASGGIGGPLAGKVLGKQLSKTALGKVGIAFAGEGAEEVASDVLNPILKRVTGVDENASMPTLSELGRTFAVGGATGAVLGGAKQVIDAAQSGSFKKASAQEDVQTLEQRNADNNMRQADEKKATYTQEDINNTKLSLSTKLQKMAPDVRETFIKDNKLENVFNKNGTVKDAAPAPENYNKDSYSASLQGQESRFAFKPVELGTAVGNVAKKAMNVLTKLTKGTANIVLTNDAILTDNGEKANGLYKDGIIYLDANATMDDKVQTVGAHEVIHTLEGTKEYNDLAKYVAETISNDSALQEKYNYEKYRAVYDSILEGDWSEITKDYQATTEIFADYLANEVLSNEDILNRLGKRKDKGVLGTILGKLFEWIKDAIDRFGMTELELEAKRVLRNMERKLGKALDAGRGGVSLETVERNAREAERTKEQAVAKNATLALARAKINIDNKGKTSYNKKRSYYSQFNTLATSWASKAEKGELFAGYDGNSYRIVIATGDDYLYENYKTVDANNDALIEYYEEFIKENNERIQRESQEIRKLAESITLDEGFYDNYSSITTREPSNVSNGRVFKRESQRNGERNTEESSRNQRGVKSSSRALLDVNFAEKAKKHYGSTYRWNETGYILQDGTRLDLSGRNEGARGGYRTVDHRDIFDIVEDADTYGTEAMNEFIARGNIRVMPETPGINVQVEPNAEQYRLIQDFVERVGWNEGYFSVDIDNEFGDTIETLTYEGRPSGRKVVADLKQYFKTGAAPYQSKLSAFRYSLDVNSPKAQREAVWTSLLSRYVHCLNLTKDVKADVVELYGKDIAKRIFSVWENTSSKGGVELITAHRELERDGFRTYAQSPADFLGDMDTTLRNIALKTYAAAENGKEILQQETVQVRKKDFAKSSDEVELSARQVQQVAKYTKQKVYSKQDAEIIVNNLLNGYMNYEDEVGSLSGKSRKQVVQMLWEGMNKAAPGQKTKIAMKVADYLIQHTVMENIRNDSMVQMHSDTIDALTPYLHKLNLDNIKEDLRYHFGDNSPYLRWGKRNGEKGIGIDVAAMELTEKGFYIEEINNVDILLRINELYQTAINGIKQKSKRYVNEVLDEGSQKALKQDVAKAVLRAFDAHGSESELTKVLREYDQRVQNWKEKYYEERDRNYLTSNVLYKVQQLKDIERGTFANASEFKNNIFKKSIGLLSRIKYRGNLNKSGTRKILGSLLEWYVPENPVLEGEVYNDEIAKMLMQLADNTKPLTAEQYDLLAELEEKSGLKSFDKLKEWYTRENLGNKYSKVVKAWLNSLADATEFTADELRALGNVVDYFKNFIEKYNKVYRNGKLVEALPLAEKYIKQLQQHKRAKIGWIRKPFEKYMRTFADPMTIARYYDGYEDGFFTETIEMLREGAIAAVEMEQNLQAPLEAFYQKHKKFLKESYDRTIEYQGEKMSIQQAMLLYMTLKRDQAIRGLAYSGFKYRRENETVSIKGFATEENLDIDSLRTLALQEQETISRQFNDAEREYISIVEKIFNEDCKKAKSETDILRQGYTNISDGYYVPIRRASIAQNVEKWTYKDELVTVGEFSFNKDTVTGAKNQLFIDSLTDVLSKHVGGISQYSNLAIALDSYNILYNLNISGNPNIAVNVKSESENVWQEGGQYIGELIDDIKGKSKSKGSGQKFIRQIRSGYAKYQLGANPKVWVTQLSSFAAATNILDIDSIVRGFGVNAKGEVVDEYCSLAKIRNNENSAALAQGVIEKTGKIGDILMKPIGAVDRWVVRRLFAACQVQVAKGGGAKLGTKDNLTKAGELLTRVILETQQNALATERSAAMRSGNEIMKSFTMFSADSMKVLGRVVDGVGEVATLRTKIRLETDSKVKAQLKEQLATANKKASRAISALITSALFMASIALGFKWLYNKDDKDEEVVKNLTVDAIGNLFGGLPFIRDVYSFFSDGYEVQNFAYVAFNDLLDSVTIVKDLSNSLIEGKEVDRRELIRSIRKLTYSSGQILGIPTRNMYNVAYGLTKRLSPETAYKWNDAFYKASYKSDLAKAIENEDDEMISTIVGLMLNENVGGIEDETTREVMDSLVTSGYNIIPKSVPDEITYKENEETVKMSLTKKQKESFAKAYYTAKEAAARLVQSAQFNKLGQEEQAAALKLIYNSYYNFAVDNCLERDSTNKNVLFMSAFELSTFAVILAQIKSIAADTNKQGKAISGSRKAKIIKYIESLRLTAAQKYMILGYLGYKNTKGEEVVRKYINGLNLSSLEKNSLFMHCGYEN